MNFDFHNRTKLLSGADLRSLSGASTSGYGKKDRPVTGREKRKSKNPSWEQFAQEAAHMAHGDQGKQFAPSHDHGRHHS